MSALGYTVSPISVGDAGTGQTASDSSGSNQQLTIPSVTNGQAYDISEVRAILDAIDGDVGNFAAKQGFVGQSVRPNRPSLYPLETESSSSSQSSDLNNMSAAEMLGAVVENGLKRRRDNASALKTTDLQVGKDESSLRVASSLKDEIVPKVIESRKVNILDRSFTELPRLGVSNAIIRQFQKSGYHDAMTFGEEVKLLDLPKLWSVEPGTLELDGIPARRFEILYDGVSGEALWFRIPAQVLVDRDGKKTLVTIGYQYWSDPDRMVREVVDQHILMLTAGLLGEAAGLGAALLEGQAVRIPTRIVWKIAAGSPVVITTPGSLALKQVIKEASGWSPAKASQYFGWVGRGVEKHASQFSKQDLVSKGFTKQVLTRMAEIYESIAMLESTKTGLLNPSATSRAKQLREIVELLFKN